MCGIAGIVYHNQERAVDPADLQRMCHSLIHRGPDDEGFHIDRNAGIGMRRLKVIDLATGHQPISNEDGRLWIVFNGEIYNYPVLRKELEERGHRFSTHTDTETILHAYEEYGEDCVTRLNGMFAFAIWDRHQRKLFLSRDRLGVKPLYYALDKSGFVFGSELKALLECREISREMDLEALDRFLTFEYIPAPLSIFKSIKKLLPGHSLVYQNGKISIHRYWDLRYNKVDKSEDELATSLYSLLRDSVRIRLLSDVPLGAFLSGGIDSSTIVCIMSEIMDRPVQTFSIGFEEPTYNELSYARAVAKHFGTEHHEETIRPDIVGLVERLVRHLDEPLADVSIFPTYLVSQLARRNVTVVLSGDGGDELFAGYDWYVADKAERFYRQLPSFIRNRMIPSLVDRIPPSAQKKGAANKAKRFVEGALLPQALQHFRWNVFLTEDRKALLYSRTLKELLKDIDTYAPFLSYLSLFKEVDPLWQQEYGDIKTFMVDDILAKVDRMSMANSLEARTPFLDYRVVEFAMQLPSSFKMRGFQTKYLLKKAMRGKLPPQILHRKKEGFSIPIKNWLRQELRPMMEEVLSEERIRAEGLFNPAYVRKLKTEHLDGVANHSHQLWPLMVFQIWRSIYLK
jgi:asparagine synthase (glutamine-hydrolysing)